MRAVDAGPDGEGATRKGGPMAGEQPARPRQWLQWWALPILVTVAFLILQPLLGSGWALFPDSYRYAKQAEKILGASPGDAHMTALHAFCESRADQAFRADTWVPIDSSPAERAQRVTACLEKYGAAGDLTTLDPRYQSIFTTRPGYPVLLAPFVAAWGVIDGMRVLGFALAAAGGLVAYAVLRLAGLSALAAGAGQVVYLVSPLGWWALQGLGEGLVDLCVLGAVAGVVLALRGRARAGIAVMAASWLALGFVRFSSLLLISAAMAAACVALGLWAARARRRAMFTLAGVCAGATALTMLAMPVLGLPGAAVTLQDTFTNHFADPLVPDPWWRLAAANVHFWPAWLATPSASWAVLACALIGAAALVRWRRDLLWPALALFAAGAAQVAAHPLPQEAERLGLLMWIPATFGLAVLVHVATRRFRSRV